MRQEADRKSTAWSAFFGAWWHRYKDQPITAGELVVIAERALADILGNGSERSRATRLGLALRRMRGRIFAGLRLEEIEITDDDSRERTAWGLVLAPSEGHVRPVDRLDVRDDRPTSGADKPVIDRWNY